MKNKRIVSKGKIVLFTLIVAAALPACAQQEYTPEKYFNIKIIDSGKSVEITKYTGINREVRIPPRIQKLSVKVIGDEAFKGGDWVEEELVYRDNHLTSVTIPNSVTHIGDWAFEGNQLTSVAIPNSITHIGEGAFMGNQLTSVAIPNSITHIGDAAFYGNQLTSVAIPNSVTHIGDFAFYENQLTNVVIPNSVTHIGDGAFFKNRLTSVIIPNSVTYIGKGAFMDNRLTSVTIPNSVTHIGDGAFYVNRLTSVTIPNSVTHIGVDVFDKGLDAFYKNNRSRAGTYSNNNGRWSYSVNNNDEKPAPPAPAVTGNTLANTTWNLIAGSDTPQTIVFGESGFRWTGEPSTLPSGSTLPGRNEVGTYRVQGDIVYLSVPGFTYTGMLLGNTLSISGGFVGWEFRRVR
jgi:hypothetical protein